MATPNQEAVCERYARAIRARVRIATVAAALLASGCGGAEQAGAPEPTAKAEQATQPGRDRAARSKTERYWCSSARPYTVASVTADLLRPRRDSHRRMFCVMKSEEGELWSIEIADRFQCALLE
jgi:hypothetical protein